MKSKPHFIIKVHFYRQKLLALPKPPKEWILSIGNVRVQHLTEAVAWAKELIGVNARGVWQTPDPYEYFFKIERQGVERAKVRENMAGTDGETGAARRRGEVPKLGIEQ